MTDFAALDHRMDQLFAQNTLRAWLMALVVFLAMSVGLLLLRRLAIARLSRIASHTSTQADDVVVDMIRRTRGTVIVLMSLLVATLTLRLPLALRADIAVAARLALLVQVGLWGTGAIVFVTQRYLRRHESDATAATTITALSYAGRLVFWAFLFLGALRLFDVDITTLVAGLGITGIAVALAVQSILSDIFGALSIVLDKPFVVGDTIQVDGYTGTVERIGLKTTRLRATAGEQLIIANADLLKSRLRNFKRQFERRVETTFGLDPELPLELAERVPVLVREIVTGQEQVRFDRCHLEHIGDSALLYELVYVVTVADYGVHMDRQQAIQLAMLRRFRELGIRFARPARSVWLHDERAEPARTIASQPARERPS